MNSEFRSSVEDDKNGQAHSSVNTAPELEVVEGKEGPNNEVVYQYQGDFFYVDRENKKLVKAEESELEDANNEIIVKDAQEENSATSDRSDSQSERNQN